jgi:hypothetical protein
VIRNSHRARRRGWITTSTTGTELSVSLGANGPREIKFRWRSDDDKRDAAAAEAEQRRDGKHVVSIAWDDPEAGKLIDHEASSEPSNKD